MQKHKVLAFIIALAVSVCLWVYAVTVVNPDDKKSINDIRVRITGVNSLTADGLMLTSDEEQFVDVEVTGRRSDLKELNSSTLEATADVSNIEAPGTYEVTWNLSTPPTVASGDISLISASSTRIKVTVSERRDREIPIIVEYTDGQLPEGYLCGDVSLLLNDETAETMVVSGPAEEVDQIATAVVTVDLTGRKTKIDEKMPYVFRDKEGKEVTLSSFVTLPAENIQVKIPVLPYKDIALSVKFIPGGGLWEKDLTWEINTKSIRVTGEENLLRTLNDEYVIEVDLGKTEGVGEIKLTHSFELPQGVTRWGENASNLVTVEITLKTKSNIGIYRLPIDQTNLLILNGEEGMEYSYADTDLYLEVRGTVSELERLRRYLSSQDISILVRVDIEKMDRNTYYYPMKVELPQGFAVGLFREYSTQLTKTAMEPPEE